MQSAAKHLREKVLWHSQTSVGGQDVNCWSSSTFVNFINPHQPLPQALHKKNARRCCNTGRPENYVVLFF